MDTRFLESFVILTESASVADAARRLRLTAAALTLRIRTLEEEVGYPLVSRTGRTVRPTAAGLRLADHARDVLRGVRDLKALGDEGELKGELRLGVAASAVAGVLCTLLLDLARERPGIELSVAKGSSSTLYAQLLDGSIDAALMFEPGFATPKSLDWRAIRSEPYVVIAAADLAGEDAHHLLRTQPFIRYDRKLWSGQIADQHLRRSNIQPMERLELDGLEAIAVLVDRGLGVSLVPDWQSPWPEGLTLAKRPLPGEPLVRTLGILWGRSSARLPLIKTVVDLATRQPSSAGDRLARGKGM